MISSGAASAHSQKLLKYTQDILSTKPYKSTQQDLCTIAQDCESILENIYTVLSKCGFPIESSDSRYLQLRKIDNMLSTDHAVKPHDRSNPSTYDKRSEISKFEYVLRSILDGPAVFQECRICAQLLLDWYHSRFLSTSKSSSKFRYNINQIREWVIAIVVAYSRSVFDEVSDEFVQKFKGWCVSVTDPNSPQHRDPLPYDVYLVAKNIDESCLTSTSLVMWDVLFDTGLKAMVHGTYNYIYFDKTDILSLCKSACPRLAFWHEDYKSMTAQAVKLVKLHTIVDSEVIL